MFVFVVNSASPPDRFKQLTDHTLRRFHVGQYILHSVRCAIFAVSVTVQP